MSTKTPIAVAEIRQLDRLRFEFKDMGGELSAVEYRASGNAIPYSKKPGQHYLLNRPVPPVVLPQTVGTVLIWNPADSKGERAAVRVSNVWDYQGPSLRAGTYWEYTDAELLAELQGNRFKVLRSEAEVANEVCAELLGGLATGPYSWQFGEQIRSVAAKWATK